MARYKIVTGATIPAALGAPALTYRPGDIAELTAAQVAAISTAGGTTRAVSATAGTGACGNRDTLGESVAASNSTP